MKNVRRGCGLLAVLMACGGDSTVTPGTLTLVARGRSERGLSVHVALQKGGDTTLVAAQQISITPADAATVQANGDVLLLKAGALTITGSAAGGSASLALTVAAPPAIAFDGLAVGNRDIYRMALDGGELARLTTNAADDVRPSVNGDVVLFTSFRDGNGELYTVSINGTGERRRTQTSSTENQGSLSPDGRRVAYTSNVTGVSKVWLGAIDLSSTAEISASARLSAVTAGDPSSPEAGPAWAPASDRIMYVAATPPSGGSGLFIANAGAGAVPALVAGSGSQGVEVEPSWNADGFRVAYAAVVAGATEVFVRDLRTSAVTQLTRNTGTSGQPAWLADGRILFTSFLVSSTLGVSVTLHWVDPLEPFVVHDIPTPGLSAEHAVPVRR
ncbi:MAG: domain protein beta Propeller [Gemmatimonadetes bacterium]|nr:domain protein beta Propeller [Gemmatimonadota bacterium]